MKNYLVGGAVRDALLGMPVTERDFVVVGADKNTLLQQGFQQVGRDFPVFLHPHTKEEYALARKEKKSGEGYYGFTCIYSSEVTLEEDLARRDLTINAIAQDETGKLIDPYHGQRDIQAKILRHISPAFAEDPVRVLRVARFAARYASLGFQVHETTLALMYQMGQKGELQHLVAERVWQEWQKSLETPNPEEFIHILRACGALQYLIPELDALFGIPNSAASHPEIDTGIHSLLVLQRATILSSCPIVRFAALVHDLGKARTPMYAWPQHPQHAERGLAIITHLCQRLRIPNTYQQQALLACKLHLQIHALFTLSAEEIVATLEKADAFRKPALFRKLLLVAQADIEGRAKAQHIYPQKALWHTILQDIATITIKELICSEKLQGAEIKHALRKLRIARVETLLQRYRNSS